MRGSGDGYMEVGGVWGMSKALGTFYEGRRDRGKIIRYFVKGENGRRHVVLGAEEMR